MALALSVMAPLTLARPAAADTTTTTTPLAPVGPIPSPPSGSVPAGQLPSSTPIQLSVVLRSSDPKGLERTALAVSTPGSAQYRHYLTPSQVQQRFGPAPGAVAAVDAYLSSHGLTVGPTLADGLIVTASGAAGSVSGALHTGIMRYRARTGRVTYANTTPPQVPSAIAPNIAAVNGLDDAVQLKPLLVPSAIGRRPSAPSPTLTAALSKPKSGAATPCSAASKAASTASAYTADQLAAAYGFSSNYGSGDLGKGVTVAVFELAGYGKGDIAAFQTCYGINDKVVAKKVDGGAPHGDATIEAELDIEGIISMAPKAKLLVYEAPNTTTGLLDAYGAIVNDNQAQVVSTSWGVCEPDAGAFASSESTLFQQMAVQGQTMVAAAGDTGSEDCYGTNGSSGLRVDDPGSQPWVTSVGGTDLTAIGPAPTESVWNDNAGAGGGGISQLWSMPSWQTGAGVFNGYSSGAPCRAQGFCREVPDVSASASPNNGYVMFCTVGKICKMEGKGWFSVGGTSASAPLWAAMLALAAQGTASPIGFVNPALYQIGATSAFNDITSGDNDFTGTNGGRYPATSQFDLATGWGSPNAVLLVPILRVG